VYRFHLHADGSAHRVGIPLCRLLREFQLRAGIDAETSAHITRAWSAPAFGKQVWQLCTASTNQFIGLEYGSQLASDASVTAAIDGALSKTLLELLESLTRFHAVTGITLSNQIIFERQDCLLDTDVAYRGMHPLVERFVLQACIGFVCMTLLQRGLPVTAIRAIDSVAMQSEDVVPAGWEHTNLLTSHNCRLRFDASALQRPLALDLATIASNLRTTLPKIYARSPLLIQVQHALADSEKLLDAEQMCRLLHVSNATLHRALKASGTHFQALLNREKFARASRWLSLENATIEETAHRLGYSDASNFRRAFKKWSGVCPSTLRQK